jgi:cytochrome c oxidase subunit 2
MTAPVRKKLFVLALFALLALAVAHTAGATDKGFSPLSPRAPQARGIDDIYWLILGITAAIFVLVEGTLLLFLIRFRSRGRPREVEGPQIRGHTRLELLWTAVPVLILVGIITFVFIKLPGIKDVPAASAESRLNVKIEGHQFYWNFTYPNGVIQVNRLRAPAQRVVTLDIRSADVDHSWWIPQLDGKFDALPGKTNHTWFKAPVGRYEGQCGEFCGLQHAVMLATVETLPSQSFDQWLTAEDKAQRAGTSSLGKMTYDGACATCHGMKGQGLVGPALKNNPLLNDKKALATVIKNGRNKMPRVGATWTDRQLNATIAYLQKNLAPKGGATSGG